MKLPEIINHAELEQKLDERQALVTKWPAVSLVEVCNGVPKPIRDLDHAELDLYFANQDHAQAQHQTQTQNLVNGNATQPILRIFLLKSLGMVQAANGRPVSEEESAAVNPRTLRLLREKAGLSNLFIAATCATGHWYTIKHVSFEHQDQHSGMKTFETFYEFIVDVPACMQFFSDFESNTYFCLNLPTFLLTRFIDDVRADPRLASRLFYFDVIVADEVMKKWQRDMKTQRDTLKTLEKKPHHTNLDAITRELHTLSQGWHIHFRNLSDFEALVRFIQAASKQYFKLSHQQKSKRRQNVRVMDRGPEMGDALKYLSSSCQSLRYLVTDYRGRTNIQINLLFHLTNQAESRANKEIATLTAELARKTRQDSASMITIAAVTMFFLPGTFLASFMNTVFFNFAEHDIRVSDKVWIFPVTTVPLTALVFAIWLGWMRMRRHRTDNQRPHKNAIKSA